MTADLTIGAFSRITRLSVKTLRHYHDWGLLEPSDVDEWTGYRRYSTAQVPTAQAIRRFRDLEMPVADIKTLLATKDGDTRTALIAAHLRRMEEQLARTQDAVSSLRALIERGAAPVAIEYRREPALAVLAISETVARAELAAWWTAARAELAAVMAEFELTAAGPNGGTFAHALFVSDAGEATVYVPVDAPDLQVGRVGATALPARQLAVTVHEGPHRNIDLAYGALGSHVADRGLEAAGPVYERYLLSALDGTGDPGGRTEIGWPIHLPAAD